MSWTASLRNYDKRLILKQLEVGQNKGLLENYKTPTGFCNKSKLSIEIVKLLFKNKPDLNLERFVSELSGAKFFKND